MAEPLKVYMDQMFRRDVAQALLGEGHDVMRASEVGQARADDHEILQKAITGIRFVVDNSIKSRHTANAALKQAGLPKKF